MNNELLIEYNGKKYYVVTGKIKENKEENTKADKGKIFLDGSNVFYYDSDLNLKKIISNIDLDKELERINEEIKNISIIEGDSEEVIEKLNKIEDEFNKKIESLKKSVSDGKEMVANSITLKGVATSKEDTFLKMSENIKNINQDSNNKYEVGINFIDFIDDYDLFSLDGRINKE